MSAVHKGDIGEGESKGIIKSSTPVSGGEDSGNSQAPRVDYTGIINEGDRSKFGPNESEDATADDGPLWNPWPVDKDIETDETTNEKEVLSPPLISEPGIMSEANYPGY